MGPKFFGPCFSKLKRVPWGCANNSPGNYRSVTPLSRTTSYKGMAIYAFIQSIVEAVSKVELGFTDFNIEIN